MSEQELHPVPNYPDYYIALDGQMYSRRRGTLHKLTRHEGRYCTVYGTIRVQTALLMALVSDRPAGCEATFIDGDSNNLALSNLKWATRKEIIDSAINRGTLHPTPRGTPSKTRRLSDHQIQDIRTRITSGEKQSTLAREYSVSEPVISWVKTGRTYKRPSTPQVADSQLVAAGTSEHQDLGGTLGRG